jgi:hypothetical protein
MSIEHQRMKENVLGDRIDSIVRKQDKKDVGAIFDVQRQQIELESLTDTKEEGGSTEEYDNDHQELAGSNTRVEDLDGHQRRNSNSPPAPLLSPTSSRYSARKNSESSRAIKKKKRHSWLPMTGPCAGGVTSSLTLEEIATLNENRDRNARLFGDGASVRVSGLKPPPPRRISQAVVPPRHVTPEAAVQPPFPAVAPISTPQICHTISTT